MNTKKIAQALRMLADAIDEVTPTVEEVTPTEVTEMMSVKELSDYLTQLSKEYGRAEIVKLVPRNINDMTVQERNDLINTIEAYIDGTR